MAHGHSVRLAAPARFEGLITSSGVPFAPFAGNPEELSRQMNNAGHNFIKIMSEIMSHALEIGEDIFHQTEEYCKDADLIIHTFLHAVGGHTLARQKNIPDVHVQLFPMFTPTRDYPNVTMPNFGFGQLNQLTHRFASRATWIMSKWGFEYVRRRAGLPRQRLYWPFDQSSLRPRTPILCAWSPSVVPPSRDWPPHVHVTGYLFGKYDVGYRATAELQRFLDAGEPPVCVSFGSMLNRDASKMDQIIREALMQTNNRGVVLSGWSEVTHVPSNKFLYLKAVPHAWLLPRCRMILHHGGAGTTSAGLRAGIPNIVIPHTADQPFWGSRVHALGAGPKPIPVKKLTIENLMQAIAGAEDALLRKDAQAIGQKLSQEDGVKESVACIEKYSDEFHRQR